MTSTHAEIVALEQGYLTVSFVYLFRKRAKFLQPILHMVVSAAFCRLGTDPTPPSRCHEWGHGTKLRFGAEGFMSCGSRGVVIRMH